MLKRLNCSQLLITQKQRKIEIVISLIRFFDLNTGTKIPSVGLGTWHASPGLVGDVVAAAIEVS